MAFMMPVVRNEWKVYDDGSRSRESKSRSRSRQSSECRWQSHGSSLSTSPKGSASSETHQGLVNRSLALDIRPVAPKHRFSVGSLPSSFHSGHLSPSYGGSPRSTASSNLSLSKKLLKSRFKKNLTLSEPLSPGKAAAIVSPRSDDESPPKSGSLNSLQKFHARLVDRLRRALRLSPNEDKATAETGN